MKKGIDSYTATNFLPTISNKLLHRTDLIHVIPYTLPLPSFSSLELLVSNCFSPRFRMPKQVKTTATRRQSKYPTAVIATEHWLLNAD